MPSYSELKEIYIDIKSDKVMLHIFRVFAGTVTLALLFAVFIFIHHAVKDKPAKLLFGLAEINTVRKDTIFKLIQSKKDTIIVYKESVKYLGFNSLTGKLIKAPKKTDTIVKNQTTVTGNDSHTITGNGNVVGVNGDIVNGIKQRHINDALLSYLIVNLPNKTADIQFLIAGGKEGVNYANEIYNALVKKGYSNLKASGWMDPDDYDKVYVDKQGDQMQIRICPASNVK